VRRADGDGDGYAGEEGGEGSGRRGVEGEGVVVKELDGVGRGDGPGEFLEGGIVREEGGYQGNGLEIGERSVGAPARILEGQLLEGYGIDVDEVYGKSP
jgi:hypothetical protein